MEESWVVRELLTEREVETMQDDLLLFLKGRFGTLPEDLVAAVKVIQQTPRLEELIDWAAQCSDLNAFRSRLDN